MADVADCAHLADVLERPVRTKHLDDERLTPVGDEERRIDSCFGRSLAVTTGEVGYHIDGLPGAGGALQSQPNQVRPRQSGRRLTPFGANGSQADGDAVLVKPVCI